MDAGFTQNYVRICTLDFDPHTNITVLLEWYFQEEFSFSTKNLKSFFLHKMNSDFCGWLIMRTWRKHYRILMVLCLVSKRRTSQSFRIIILVWMVYQRKVLFVRNKLKSQGSTKTIKSLCWHHGYYTGVYTHSGFCRLSLCLMSCRTFGYLTLAFIERNVSTSQYWCFLLWALHPLCHSF